MFNNSQDLVFDIGLHSLIITTSPIAHFSSGDARIALNTLEMALTLNSPTENDIKKIIADNSRAYDKNGNRHYDVISAFIKSMRANDPHKALLWLAVMIDGGEDPLFIARRLVIFASEDVGNADQSALTLATSTMLSVKNIGMPEARIILSQATTYLALTYKSRACYEAIDEALDFVQNQSTINILTPPKHNAFYKPTTSGKEDGLRKRLLELT